MKRHISNILTLAFLLLGVASCEVEKLEVTLGGQNSDKQLTFSFNTRAAATTADEIASEVGLNEDRIETLDLFFFENATSGTYTSHQQFTNNNDDKNTTYTVTVSTAELNMNNKTYLVYAVVNRVIPKQTIKTYTLADLKQMAANKEITVDDKTTTDKDENIQGCFVMDGEMSVILSTNMTTPVIELKRSVAKITMDIDVEDVIYVGSNRTEYRPVDNSMTVRMVNGVKNGLINGTGTADYFETVIDEKTVNPTVRSIVENETGNDHTPFYSYPYEWSLEASPDCYLYLTIDWTSENGTVGTYYYIVPIGEVIQFVRNNHYIINLDVAILGGTEEKPVTLSSNYIIENWSTLEISTELKKYKYLWVKGTSFVMNNEDELKIEYASSSKIDFESLTVQRYFSDGNNNKEKLADIDNHGVTIIDNEDGTFTVNHEIKRTGTTKDLNNYYRPWYITFNVVNEDDMSVENIRITQYPAIYAVADFNGTSTTINGTTKPSGYFNRFVNGVNKSNSSANYGGVHDISSNNSDASNKNRNQYVITVTNLGDNPENYIIGDPRVTVIDNILNNNQNWSANASDLNGNTRQITYYYPTQEENVASMISPKFRIASSWGVTNKISYENAQRRCASYQENGYPAGRWRIPTEAEIKFVNGLSADGYIPELFDGEYFASSGKYWSSSNKNFVITDNSQAVRCVYDEWYWGDKKIYNEDGTTPTTNFTWGDEEIK